MALNRGTPADNVESDDEDDNTLPIKKDMGANGKYEQHGGKISENLKLYLDQRSKNELINYMI